MPCDTYSRFADEWSQEGADSAFRSLFRSRLVRIEAQRIELAAQPRDLAFRQLARRKDRALPKRGGVRGALKMLPGLAIAHGAQCRKRRVEVAATAQRAYLVEKPGVEHRAEAPFDARVQVAAIFGNQRKLQHAPWK